MTKRRLQLVNTAVNWRSVSYHLHPCDKFPEKSLRTFNGTVEPNLSRKVNGGHVQVWQITEPPEETTLYKFLIMFVEVIALQSVSSKWVSVRHHVDTYTPCELYAAASSDQTVKFWKSWWRSVTHWLAKSWCLCKVFYIRVYAQSNLFSRHPVILGRNQQWTQWLSWKVDVDTLSFKMSCKGIDKLEHVRHQVRIHPVVVEIMVLLMVNVRTYKPRCKWWKHCEKLSNRCWWTVGVYW